MAKFLLTDVKLRQKMKVGKHYDGANGLFIQVYKSGAKIWQQRLTIDHKRTTLGLRSYPAVSVQQARFAAQQNKSLAAIGALRRPPKSCARSSGPAQPEVATQPHVVVQPLPTPYGFLAAQPFDAVHSSALPAASSLTLDGRQIPTFREASERTLEHERKHWKHEKEAVTWVRFLNKYAMDELGALRVTEIQTRHLRKVMEPIWYQMPSTARRVKSYLRAIMEWAVQENFRTDNPAAGHLGFRSNKGDEQHQLAVHHSQLGAVISMVCCSPETSVAQLVYEMTALTVLRPSLVRLARYSQINLEKRVWIIPRPQMKTKTASRPNFIVPFSDRAITLLEEARRFDQGNDLVFPSKKGKPLWDAYLSRMPRDLGIPAVPHGFRASFREWCSDTQVDHFVAEACLDHTLPSRVMKAYLRTLFLPERREVMDNWARYLASLPTTRPEQWIASGTPIL